MRMNDMTSPGLAIGIAVAVLTLAPVTHAAQDTVETHVDVQIVPYAEVEFTTPNLLYLLIPPSQSTVNASGSVKFLVHGNAKATLVAQPSDYLLVPGPDGGWMGKATKGSDFIGYQIQLTFPSNAIVGSPKKLATMPLDEAAGTTPPLTVNLTTTSGTRSGAVDLLASPDWTTHGGLPAAGLYIGSIVLTVSAEAL